MVRVILEMTLECDIQRHAFERDLHWLKNHPGEMPDYYDSGRNLQYEALDELADCYNYVSHSKLQSFDKMPLLKSLTDTYNTIRDTLRMNEMEEFEKRIKHDYSEVS